jgi:hypothetical protein
VSGFWSYFHSGTSSPCTSSRRASSGTIITIMDEQVV